MSSEAGFVQALTADPEDETTALVFADWFDEHLRGKKSAEK